MPDLQLLPIAPAPPQGDSAAPRPQESDSGDSFGKAFTQAKTSADENARERAANIRAERAADTKAERAANVKAERAANTNAERAANTNAESAANTKTERTADSKAERSSVSKTGRAGKKAPGQPGKGAKASRADASILPAPARQPGAAAEDIGIKTIARAQIESAGDGNSLPLAGDGQTEQTEQAASELIEIFMANLQRTWGGDDDDDAVIAYQPPETETDAEIQADSDDTLGELQADNGAAARQGIYINNPAVKPPLTHAEKAILKDAPAPTPNQAKGLEGAVSDRPQGSEASPSEKQNVTPDTNHQGQRQEAGNMSLEDAAKALSPRIAQMDISGDAESDPGFMSRFQKASGHPAPAEVPRAAPLIIESALPQMNKGEARILPEAKDAPADGAEAKGASENAAADKQRVLNAQTQEAANDVKNARNLKGESIEAKTGTSDELRDAPEKASQNIQDDSKNQIEIENRRRTNIQSERATEPALRASKPAEQLDPRAEQTKTSGGQAKQVAAQIKPSDDQTKQPIEQAEPSAERAKAIAEQAKQVVQHTKPSAGQVKQPARQTRASIEGASEAIEQLEPHIKVKPAVTQNQPAEQTKPLAERAKARAEQAKAFAAPAEQTKVAAEQVKPSVEQVKAAINQAKALAEQPGQPSGQISAPIEKALQAVKPGQGEEQAVTIKPHPQAAEGADDAKGFHTAKGGDSVVFRADFNLAKNSTGKERGAPETAAGARKITIAHSSGESHFALTNTGTSALNAPASQSAQTATKAALPQLPPNAPMAQLEGSVRWLLRADARGAEIQLHPANLGRVTVQIKVEGSEVHAKVWATEASTLPLLKGHRAFLETSLKEQGLTLSSFDLQHGRGGQQTQGESQRQHQRDTHHHFAPPMMETWTGTEFRQELPIQLTAQRADDGSVELYA